MRCAHLPEQGPQVVLVSPPATHQTRPMITQAFSPTDQKEALARASPARPGSCDDERLLDERTAAMPRLSIPESTLRTARQRHTARLRAHVDRLFPEFFKTIPLDLSPDILPEESRAVDRQAEACELARSSPNQHGQTPDRRNRHICAQGAHHIPETTPDPTLLPEPPHGGNAHTP